MVNNGDGLHQDSAGEVGQAHVDQHQVEHPNGGLLLLDGCDDNKVEHNTGNSKQHIHYDHHPSPLKIVIRYVSTSLSMLLSIVHHGHHSFPSDCQALTARAWRIPATTREDSSHRLIHSTRVIKHRLVYSTVVLRHRLIHSAWVMKDRLIHSTKVMKHRIKHTTKLIKPRLKHSTKVIKHISIQNTEVLTHNDKVTKHR